MDCACCGLAIGHDNNQYTDEEEILCPECGATCSVSVDEDGDAYFGAWKCAHGISGDDPCKACEEVEA